MHIREIYQITVTPLPDGAAVRFARDAHLVKSLKAQFPRARWGAGTESWHIPGKLAAARATQWADAQNDHLLTRERQARDAEWDAKAAPAAPRRITWIGIPAKFGLQKPVSAPPDGDLDRIQQAIQIAQNHETFWGVLGRPIRGVWSIHPAGWAASPEWHPWAALQTYQPGLSGAQITVMWYWAGIVGGDGWQRDGWMPDHSYPDHWHLINPGYDMRWYRP